MTGESLVERMRRRAQELRDDAPAEYKVTDRVLKEAQPEPEFDPELIPDIDLGEKSPEQAALDVVIDGIDILDAYARWCGKMTPKVGRRRESIMISCPNPAHPDKNPSAWVNLDKQTWFCGGCQEGGDKFDIAAWHFGYDVPGYKSRELFPRLREDMAASLGYQVARGVSGNIAVAVDSDEEQDPESTSDAADNAIPAPSDDEDDEDGQDATVTVIPTAATLPNRPTDIPPIPWGDLAAPDTFLGTWMETCSEDDVPEEYYFWHGLVALGLAAGHDVKLADRQPVAGNLYVCLVGPTGDGKSRSIRALDDLLRRALPYDDSDPNSTGVQVVPMPGSAESLVDCFSKPIYDPTDPSKIVGYAPVRGLLKVDEFATLAKKAERQGSVMKPTLIELYDAPNEVVLRSRGAGTVKAEMPFASLVASTQFKAIQNVMTLGDAESGFANRWIFATGTPKPQLAIGGAPLDIDGAVKALQRVRTFCSGVTARQIELSLPAVKVFTDFFNAFIVPLQGDEEESGLKSRVSLHVKKLMLLLAINERKHQVDTDVAEKAIQLFEYLNATYDAVAGRLSETEINDCIRAVAAAIERHHEAVGRWPTMRDIDRGTPRRFDRGQLLKATQLMISLGRIRELADTKKKGPGRPTVRYELVS